MVQGWYLVSAAVGADCFGLEGAIASFACLLDMLWTCFLLPRCSTSKLPFVGVLDVSFPVTTKHHKNALEI